MRPTHKQNRFSYNKARPSHKKGQKKLDLVTKKPDLNTHTVTRKANNADFVTKKLKKPDLIIKGQFELAITAENTHRLKTCSRAVANVVMDFSCLFESLHRCHTCCSHF